MNKQIDDLLATLSEEKDLLTKANILNSLSEEYYNFNRDLSHKYALEALAIAEKLRDLKEIITSKLNIASYYYSISEYDTSLIICRWILDNNNGLQDYILIGRLNRITALNYYRKADYDEALIYQYKCVEIFEKNKSYQGLSGAFTNIGNIYLDLEEYDTALEYYNKAKEHYKLIKNESGLLIVDSNIANVYNNSGRYSEAIDLYIHLIEEGKKRNDHRALASNYSHLGEVYANTNKFEEAEICFNEALEQNKINGFKWVEISGLWGLSRILQQRKKSKESLALLSTALNMAESTEIKSAIFNLHASLAEVYEEMEDYKSALFHYKKYKEVKDTVFSQARNQQVTLLKTKNIEKEKEIERLKNFELKKAYDEIDKKNEEINSSINYALRIQMKILPSHDKIRSIFARGFFLLSSKDTLSGDLYWVSKFGNKSFVAVIDCTGHGIPGALLTIIANEMLNTAFDTFGIDQPGAVLNFLNKTLRKKFDGGKSIDGSPINDGMDIAFCSFDFENNILEYAGANRPLYLVRNGELIETPPTKASIGVATPEEQIFENHIINLQKNDMIYIFSDGYADQFGMPEEDWEKLKGINTDITVPNIKRKKFMTKNFKKLLIEDAGLHIDERGKKLIEAHNKWKGSDEQTDDILVIGIPAFIF